MHEPGKITAVRLPPPMLIILVRPAMILTRQLRHYVRTFRFSVKWPSQLVLDPSPTENITPFLRLP